MDMMVSQNMNAQTKWWVAQSRRKIEGNMWNENSFKRKNREHRILTVHRGVLQGL